MFDKVKEIIGLGILGVGSAVFFFCFLKSLFKEMTNNSWSSTNADITSLDIVKKGGHGNYRYEPELKYQYSVNGKIFETDSSSLFIGYPTRGLAEKAVENYRNTKSVIVYFNPSNPSENTLQLGITKSSVFGLIASGLIMVTAIYAIIKILC